MEQAILKAAEELFLEHGFEATSTVKIAKTVGCNQALVHYYFRTKDNLFNTIFESKFKRFFEKTFDMVDLSNKSFSEKILYFADSHFNLLLENPNLPKLILKELARKPENIRSLYDKLHMLPEKLIAAMNHELTKAVEAGEVRNISLMDIILTIVTLNFSLFSLMPVACDVLGMDKTSSEKLMKHRREENTKLISAYLKPV